MTAYPHLFSEWQIRHDDQESDRLSADLPHVGLDPWNGLFTEQATRYYAERERRCRADHHRRDPRPRELADGAALMPQLWDDRNIEPSRRSRTRCTKPAASLRSSSGTGCPRLPALQAGDAVQPRRDLVHAVAEPGAARRVPRRLDAEGAVGGRDPGDPRRVCGLRGRAVAAGCDGVEFHLSHGYLPWQFLSPLYNKRTDAWGGSYENRLRFPLEALRRMRQAMGDDPFLGYRINSTSFWPGDLELEDIAKIVPDIEVAAEIDYVNVSAGVHHAFIHTPMEFEPGWEKATRARSARFPRSRSCSSAGSRRRTSPSRCSPPATVMRSALHGSCSPIPTGR